MTVKESIDILLDARSKAFSSKGLAKTRPVPRWELWGQMMGYNFDGRSNKLPDDYELSHHISKIIIDEFGEGVK